MSYTVVTEEMTKKHREKLTYHVVKPVKPGETKKAVASSRISGAKSNHWKKGEDFIFIPALRIAGLRPDVEAYVRQLYPADYPAFIGNAITKDNYNTSAEYANEIAAIEALNKKTKADKVTLTIDHDLNNIVEIFKLHAEAAKKPVAPVAGVVAPSAKGARMTFQQKLAKVISQFQHNDRSEVLDVSQMTDATSDSKSRIIKMPARRLAKNREDSGKFEPETIPYITSNNEMSLRNAIGKMVALNMVPPSDVEAHVASWRNVREKAIEAYKSPAKAVLPVVQPAVPMPATIPIPAMSDRSSVNAIPVNAARITPSRSSPQRTVSPRNTLPVANINGMSNRNPPVLPSMISPKRR